LRKFCSAQLIVDHAARSRTEMALKAAEAGECCSLLLELCLHVIAPLCMHSYLGSLHAAPMLLVLALSCSSFAAILSSVARSWRLCLSTEGLLQMVGALTWHAAARTCRFAVGFRRHALSRIDPVLSEQLRLTNPFVCSARRTCSSSSWRAPPTTKWCAFWPANAVPNRVLVCLLLQPQLSKC
jgi:hypothetical protein